MKTAEHIPAPPLQPEERWPQSTITLLERDLAAAERSYRADAASRAAAALEAEKEYLAALGATLLHHAAVRRPTMTAGILSFPLDGLRDDVLRLYERQASIEAELAEVTATLARLTAACPVGEGF